MMDRRGKRGWGLGDTGQGKAWKGVADLVPARARVKRVHDGGDDTRRCHNKYQYAAMVYFCSAMTASVKGQ
jgi:hypothetical protein